MLSFLVISLAMAAFAPEKLLPLNMRGFARAAPAWLQKMVYNHVEQEASASGVDVQTHVNIKYVPLLQKAPGLAPAPLKKRDVGSCMDSAHNDLTQVQMNTWTKLVDDKSQTYSPDFYFAINITEAKNHSLHIIPQFPHYNDMEINSDINDCPKTYGEAELARVKNESGHVQVVLVGAGYHIIRFEGAASLQDELDPATIFVYVGESPTLPCTDECVGKDEDYFFCEVTEATMAGACVCKRETGCPIDRATCDASPKPVVGEQQCGWHGDDDRVCCTKEEAAEKYAQMDFSLGLLQIKQEGETEECYDIMMMSACAEWCLANPALFDENDELISCKSFCYDAQEKCAEHFAALTSSIESSFGGNSTSSEGEDTCAPKPETNCFNGASSLAVGVASVLVLLAAVLL